VSPEQQTRAGIDRPLASVGWSVMDVANAGTKVSPGVAIHDFPHAYGHDFADSSAPALCLR
jgi:hypothetical protein